LEDHYWIRRRFGKDFKNHGLKSQIGDDSDVCFLYIVEIDKNRDHFANELKKRGVKVNVHYMPIH